MLNDSLNMPDALTILYRNAGPVSRRRALIKALRYLMSSNKRRIKNNLNSDGAAMEPRRNSSEGKMFKRLPTHMNHWLKADLAQLGFVGRMGWIASNHQFGRSVDYKNYTTELPIRELLGISGSDFEHIKGIFLEHLTAGVN